jgi:hypothetical protein
MQTRPQRPRFQTASKEWVRGSVQPLEHFPRLRVFILQNLPAPLESGLPYCYIGELVSWKRLIYGHFGQAASPQ